MATLSLNDSRLLDPSLLDSGLAALAECTSACHRSADAWLARSPLGPDALRCVRLLVDCGDLCESAVEVLSDAEAESPVLLRSRVNACIFACERAGREISRHRAPFASACVEACRHAAAICRQVTTSLSTAAVVAA